MHCNDHAEYEGVATIKEVEKTKVVEPVLAKPIPESVLAQMRQALSTSIFVKKVKQLEDA